MKAVLTTGFNEFTIDDIPRPSVSSNEVLVKVNRVQLSVTECMLYQGAEIAHHETIKSRIENADNNLFGHEFIGTVVETDELVSNITTGDRVYVPGKLPCHNCPYCTRGYEHFCKNKQSLGFDRPGALSEYILLPSDSVRKLPDEVSDAEGAAMQPLASSLLCAIDARISPGDVAVVIGTGVIGFQCAQLAAHFGAQEVICVDVRAEPLAIAANRGLTTIDASDTDVQQIVTEITGHIGADVVFEAAGGNQSNATSGTDPLALAYNIVRTGGNIVQVGHIVGELAMEPRKFRSKSISWINPRKGVLTVGPNADTGELAPQLVANDVVSIEDNITHELSGLESFDKAVDITLNKRTYDALGPAQIVID